MPKFGLIGKTLSHSFSAKYFSEKFENEGLKQHSYENVELESVDALKTFKKDSFAMFSGLNVTIPYKQDAFALCDELSPEAEAIGAVNCIKVIDNKWVGYNTDAYGFIKSLAPFLEPQHSKALVFGTGGASKAIVYALKQKGIQPYLISRSAGDILLKDIDKPHLQQCKLLVNCTPLGTSPNINECLELPYQALTEQHLAVDLIYNPPKTLFLQKAEEQNACIVNGKAMLHFQAEKSWDIWNKV